MPAYALVLFGAAIALTGVALVAGVVSYRQLAARIAELERRADPATRHDWKALERHDIGEAGLWQIAEMRNRLEELQLLEQQLTAFLEHVAAGGHPGEPRSRWLKLRKDDKGADHP